MKTLIFFCAALAISSSSYAQSGGAESPSSKSPPVKWKALESVNLADFNSDLVAGTQAGGYVRRIASIEQTGSRFEIATTDVPLGSAIGDGKSQLAKTSGGSTSVELGFAVDNISLSGGDGSGILIDIDHAALTFKPQVDLDLELSGGHLQHFLAAVSGDLAGTITVHLKSQNGFKWNYEKQLWSTSQTFLQWVGWVPVVESVDLSAGIGIDFDVDGTHDILVTADFSSHLRGGVEYKDGSWHPLGEASFLRHGDIPYAIATGSAKVNTYVYADVHVKLYGAAGPYVKIKPGLRFQRAADGTWTRFVGITADGGAELANPFGDKLHYDSRLIDQQWPL